MIGSNQSPGDLTSPNADPPLVAPSSEALAEPSPLPPPTPAARRPGPVRRAFEWIWQGRAMATLRAEGRIGSPRALELLRRGWRAVELAERMLNPVPRLLNGTADAEAREILRQGLFWALSAEVCLRQAASQVEAGESTARDGRALLELWGQAERQLLVDAAGDEAAAHALEVALRVDDFADFADLDSGEQARQARDLLAFLRALLVALETPRVRLDRVWTRRILRTSGTLFVVFGLLAGILVFRSQQERDRDLARDRPYKTSSAYPAVGCKSPEQDCPESPFYFFHTLEDEPAWIEIDLGGKHRVSAVKLVNREDCCADRAAPLAVEISTDHKAWHEVARRTEVFNTWYTTFEPVSARWVRVITLRKSALHLKRVAVLR